MRARYHDLIWEHSRNYKHAQDAVSSYLEYARLCTAAILSSAGTGDRDYRTMILDNAVRRAMGLAAALNDTDLLVSVVGDALDIVDQLLAVHQPHWCDTILGDMLEVRPVRRVTSADGLRERIDLVIAELRRPPDQEPWEFLRRGLRLRRRHGQVFGDAAMERQARLDIAANYREEADWKTEHGMASFMGASLYQKAVSAYQAAGGTECEVEECMRRIEELNTAAASEMKQLEVEIPIPREHWEQWTSAVDRAADELGVRFLSLGGLLGAPVANARNQVAEMIRSNPLLAMTPRTGISGQRIVDRAESPDEQSQTLLVEQIQHYLRWQYLVVKRGCDRLAQEGHMSAAEMMAVLQASDVVSPNRLPLLRIALDHYEAGDGVSFAHVVTPQIEGVLRDLVGLLGGARTKDVRGTTQVRSLGEILEDARLTETLGEDFTCTLRVLLTESRGLNLRNDIAHGELLVNPFSDFVCTMLLLVLMQIGGLRLVPAGDQADTEEEVPDD